MRLNCERTNCSTNKITQEIHFATVETGFDGFLWVKLSPGITGYESASVKDLIKGHTKSVWFIWTGTLKELQQFMKKFKV